MVIRVNSQDETQLEEAYAKLVELRSHVIFLGAEDYSIAAYPLNVPAPVGINTGVNEAIEGQAEIIISNMRCLKMGNFVDDNFVVPANSPNQYTAFVFLNFC